MGDEALTAASAPVPSLAVVPTPAPGLRGPAGLSPRQNYSRVNTGAPEGSDSGALEQKSIMPKVGSVMSISMATRPRALNDMLKTAMESALGRAKIAEEAKKQLQNLEHGDEDEDRKEEKKEKDSCMKTSSADFLPTDYVLKLAAASDYIVELLKEGADLAGPYTLTENVQGAGLGPQALKVTPTEPWGPDHVIAGRTGEAGTNKPPTAPGVQKARPVEHGATQLDNDKDRAPGAGDPPVSGSSKNAAPTWLLRKMAEGMDPDAVIAPQPNTQDEAAWRAARNAALTGGALGAAGGALGAGGAAGIGALGRQVTPEMIEEISSAAEDVHPGVGRTAKSIAKGLQGIGEVMPKGLGRNAALIGGSAALGAGFGAVPAGLGALAGGQADTGLSGAALGGLGGAAGSAGLGALGGAGLGAALKGKGRRLIGAGLGALSGGLGGLGGALPGAIAGVYGKEKVDRALLEQAAGEKMSAPIWLLRKLAEDAINPAQVAAGSAESTRMPISVTGEAGPPASGKERVPGTAEGVADMTRREAKSVPKAEMGKVIDEPMNSAAHDNVLQQAFAHTSDSGAKISAAQIKVAAAKALLRNLAEGGK